eukprot:1171084-Prymnesium_polylepis.1
MRSSPSSAARYSAVQPEVLVASTFVSNATTASYCRIRHATMSAVIWPPSAVFSSVATSPALAARSRSVD